MNYPAKILIKEHSKAATLEVVTWVGCNEERFGLLMDCIFSTDKKLAQRASWPLGYIGIEYPSLVYPYIRKLLDEVQKPVHQAIKRNTFRYLSAIEIPEEYVTDTLTTCLNILERKKESVAVLCFSFWILIKLSKRYPDLKAELFYYAELYEYHQSAGIQSVLKKIRGYNKVTK